MKYYKFFLIFFFIIVPSLVCAETVLDAEIQTVQVDSSFLYFVSDSVTYVCSGQIMQDLILYQYRADQLINFEYTVIEGQNIVDSVQSSNFSYLFEKFIGLLIGALSAGAFIIGYSARVK